MIPALHVAGQLQHAAAASAHTGRGPAGNPGLTPDLHLKANFHCGIRRVLRLARWSRLTTSTPLGHNLMPLGFYSFGLPPSRVVLAI